MMRKAAIYGTAIVVVHAAVTILHGIAHQASAVFASPAQNAFIAVVIVVGPLVAAALLWVPPGRLGAQLLLGSMGGSLVFGLYYHFVVPSPDHVSQAPADGWGVLFQVTAVLLLLTEGIGCWTGRGEISAPATG